MMAAANFDLNGFHTLYSVFFSPTYIKIETETHGRHSNRARFEVGSFTGVLTSTDMRFSPYTDSPGTPFNVTKTSSFPRAMNTPGR